jgi:hypothetical protein
LEGRRRRSWSVLRLCLISCKERERRATKFESIRSPAVHSNTGPHIYEGVPDRIMFWVMLSKWIIYVNTSDNWNMYVAHSGVRFPARASEFLFSPWRRPSLPYSGYRWAVSPRLKWPESETDHSPPSNAEATNGGAIPSRLLGVMLK